MPTLVPASPSSIDVDDDDSDAPPSPPRRRHQLDLQSTGEIAAPTTRRDVWVVAATTVGNALEWYDFALFGFLAPELATKFFPPKKHLNSALLETFLVFGAAFLVRPIGGLAMGAFSDKHGRKRALQLSVIAMSGATASIGLLPTYAMAGSLATCLLVLCRLVQGLSVAGQLTGALVYLVESAPPGHEHLFGSLAFASGNAGTMLGGVAVAFVQTRAGQDAFAGHGWRYPFLLSAFLGWGGDLSLGCVSAVGQLALVALPFWAVKQVANVAQLVTSCEALVAHDLSQLSLACRELGAAAVVVDVEVEQGFQDLQSFVDEQTMVRKAVRALISCGL